MLKRKDKNPPTRRIPASAPVRQNVFSYHASRSPVEANTGRHESTEQRKSIGGSAVKKLQYLPIYLSIAVMVFAFLYALTLSTNPIVSIIDDSSTSLKHTASEYQSYASTASKRSLFNQFKLTIDTAALSTQLRQQFPEIETAEVTIPVLGHRSKVELTTISPVFLLTTSGGKSYYIAPDGRATSPVADYAVHPKDTISIQDQSGLPIKPGAQILTRDTVDFINQVIAQMRASKVVIISFILPTNPYELQMRIEGQPYYVKFQMLGDARVQSGDFLAVKDRLTSEGKAPGEYIDARVEGRVFYK